MRLTCMLALPRLNGKTFWFLGRSSRRQVRDVGRVVQGPVEFLENVAGVVLAGAANASVPRNDQVATPMGGFEVTGGGIEFHSHAALDDRDQMRGGDVVQNVAGDRPVNAADDQVAVERLAVRVFVLYASRYGANLDVLGGGAAMRLGPGAGDLQLPHAGSVPRGGGGPGCGA